MSIECKFNKEIVSNADVGVEVGSVVVWGVRTESVKLWLARLGF